MAILSAYHNALEIWDVNESHLAENKRLQNEPNQFREPARTDVREAMNFKFADLNDIVTTDQASVYHLRPRKGLRRYSGRRDLAGNECAHARG